MSTKVKPSQKTNDHHANGNKSVATTKSSDEEEKPSEIPHIPALDNALTVGFGICCMYLVKVLVEEEHVLEFIAHCIMLVVGRKICTVVFKHIGQRIGTEKNLSKPRNLRKFCEQSWQLMTHVIFTVIEYQVLKDVDWWENPKASYFPRELPRPGGLIRFFYLFQMATYAIGAFSHRFLEARHKDYFVMYTHHIVTLALLAGSHHLNAERFGLTVLTVHDVTDIPADLTKMANYMGLDSSTGLFLTEGCFAGVLLSWAYIRLYIYPVRILHSIFWHAGPVCEGTGKTAFQDPYWGCWILRIFMLMLGCMHYYWYYLFLKITYRLIQGTSAHSAGAKDYEGDSDDESDDSHQKQKKK
eukprot:c13511_g1_i1.p1 GENE.c13511_g1_i1~~c13511_g1_i1.p1  ORF type:complete len:381 (+),score=55.77 c13511_g1_i1:77-1144(+)